jgi:hypothetical protein
VQAQVAIIQASTPPAADPSRWVSPQRLAGTAHAGDSLQQAFQLAPACRRSSQYACMSQQAVCLLVAAASMLASCSSTLGRQAALKLSSCGHRVHGGVGAVACCLRNATCHRVAGPTSAMPPADSHTSMPC